MIQKELTAVEVVVSSTNRSIKITNTFIWR